MVDNHILPPMSLAQLQSRRKFAKLRKKEQPTPRQVVIEAIEREGKPICPLDIIATKQGLAQVSSMLRTLLKEGAIRRVGYGRYVLATTPIREKSGAP